MQQPIKYEIGAQDMEKIFSLLAQAPWIYVSDAINVLRTNAKAIYPEQSSELSVKSGENPS